ncbi:FliH/SctL family protein [Microbacterium stercoris]|uniref:Flagellar assembly protein FliH/Type III secretion system HrpE domain-containing protein n=1 Tax=Microbacterium stercoris TaxID=2820289 RepID=A0A939TNU4_9MICO|nr:FliH/SctL family protein [Microbacterium stercoris]MBO3664603.1 hypothetical protein [Microbacterium stercoris]
MSSETASGSTSPSRGASRFREVVFPRISGRSAELEREFEAARVRGYAAGHAEGMRMAAEAAALIREEAQLERETQRLSVERRLSSTLVALEEAALALAERERAVIAPAQRTLEALAIELAEAVLGAALADPEIAARAALQRALSQVDPAEVREVRLHPDDLALLQENGVSPEGVTVVPDAALAPGDALVLVPDGSIDARVASAFERARAALGELT